MPELPEVEHLRRSLEPVVVGALVRSVRIARRDVISTTKRRPSATELEQSLLVGGRIVATLRKGKQMALESDSGRVLVVQLGMTGSVTIERGPAPTGMDGKHRHVVWELVTATGSGPGASVRMAFRDPRRFGGLTVHPARADLERAWSELGPDGLTILGDELALRLKGSRRPVKSALLDQTVVAGVGNIYADESLFASSIHPLHRADRLVPHQIERLADEIRRILNQAADAGGSTLRDYRDAFGQPGDAVQHHAAYGRADEPCLRCGTALRGIRLQGRATVFCPCCQHLSTKLKAVSGTKRRSQKRPPRSGS